MKQAALFTLTLALLGAAALPANAAVINVRTAADAVAEANGKPAQKAGKHAAKHTEKAANKDAKHGAKKAAKHHKAK